MTPIRLGITGGIGCGKSYVCHLLQRDFGIPVYDCDSQAKRLCTESAEIRKALIQLVGQEVYNDDGILARPVLATYLFASSEHQQEVNAIIHPVVKQHFLNWCQEQQTPVVAMESAILLESHFEDTVDCIINVTAPLPLRIQRVKERDDADETSIRKRIALQLTDEQRSQRAHAEVINDGRDLHKQIEKILTQYQYRRRICSRLS